MKTEKNIFIAFVLNLIFCFTEFAGGLFIGSTAIISDALHDFGDALSIGVSYFFEKISRKSENEKFTFGYGRFSVLGSIITNLVLIMGSLIITVNSAIKLFNLPDIRQNEMIIFAVIGVAVNLIAMFVTHRGESLNEKAVNLHMFEDVLGWSAVLIGAIVMKLTNLAIVDPIISVAVSIYIFIHGIKHLKEAVSIILEKTPDEIDFIALQNELLQIEDVNEIKDLHLWSIDEKKICATVCIVTGKPQEIGSKVKAIFTEKKIKLIALEIDEPKVKKAG